MGIICKAPHNNHGYFALGHQHIGLTLGGYYRETDWPTSRRDWAWYRHEALLHQSI